MPKGKGRYWTAEQKEYLATVVRSLPSRDAAAKMSEYFGIEFTYEQVRAARKRYKIPNGQSGYNLDQIRGYYPPKSAAALRRRDKGLFKKGFRPHNTWPVGTVRADGEGYIEKKVQDISKVAHRVNWKRLSVIVWEKHHGPVPVGYDIVYLDGNRRHCSIENLALVEREIKPYMSRAGLYYSDPDLTRVGITLAKVKAKRYQKEGKEKNEKSKNRSASDSAKCEGGNRQNPGRLLSSCGGSSFSARRRSQPLH